MTKSLKDQLKAVAERNQALGGFQHDKTTTRKPSLLFTPQEAAQIDHDTIHEIGLKGFKELCDREPLFLRFHAALFDYGTPEQVDRSLKTAEENKVLDENIQAFMRLCQPHYQERCAQQAIEWLIRAYRVNELNVKECFDCIVAHHDTPAFVRFVQIIQFREQDPFAFLYAPVKQAGQPVSREFLAKRCVVDRQILEWQMDAFRTLLAHEMMMVKPASVSFIALLVVEFVERKMVVDGVIQAMVMPFVHALLHSITSDYRVAGMLIAGALFERVDKIDVYDFTVTLLQAAEKDDTVRAEAAMLLTRMCMLYPGQVQVPAEYKEMLAETVSQLSADVKCDALLPQLA